MVGFKRFISQSALVVGLFAVSFNSLAVTNRIAVIVNDDVITEQEITVKRQLVAADASNPLSQVLQRATSEDQARSILVDSMVKELVQRQFATRLNLFIPPQVLNEELAKLARANKMEASQFRNAIVGSGVDWDMFARDMETRLIIQGLVRNVIAPSLSVSDFEIEEFLRQSNMKKPQSFDFEHLVVKLTDGDLRISSTEEDSFFARLESIREASVSAEEFQRVSAQFANESTNVNYQNVGVRSAKQLPDLFVSELKQLSDNEISPIIRTDGAIHLIYLKAKQTFGPKGAEKRKLAHILISANTAEERKVAVARLNKIRQRAINGESFSDLAIDNSDDSTSAALGGSLGWIKQGDTVPEFEKSAFALDINSISYPVSTQFGAHIIKLLEVGQQDEDESLRAIARSRVVAQKANQQYPVWLSSLVSQAYIKTIN